MEEEEDEEDLHLQPAICVVPVCLAPMSVCTRITIHLEDALTRFAGTATCEPCSKQCGQQKIDQ
jgi:hypothetical protein